MLNIIPEVRAHLRGSSPGVQISLEAAYSSRAINCIHVASLPACMSWSYQCADNIMPFSACYTEYYTKWDNLGFSDYVACRKDQGAWDEVRIKCPYFREYYIIVIMIVTKTEYRKSSQDVERVWRLQRVETQSRRFPTELWASAQHHT